MPDRRSGLKRVVAGMLALGLPAALRAGAQPGGEVELRTRLQRAELLAGLTPVEGPGLVVTLRHSPRAVPRGVDRRNFLVQEQDLVGTINALRAAGAEALAIGGAQSGLERLLATTSVTAGSAGVTVNGRLLQPPYRVLAIGDPPALRAELFREGGIARRAGLAALGMMEVQESSRLQLPAGRVAGGPRFARVSAEPEESPALSAPPPGAGAPAGEAPVPRGTGTAVFGGRGLTRYHVPGCRFGERLPPAQRFHFGSVEEAVKAGRRACRTCAGRG